MSNMVSLLPIKMTHRVARKNLICKMDIPKLKG